MGLELPRQLGTAKLLLLLLRLLLLPGWQQGNESLTE
jgi:hypothetical protein